MFVVTGRILSIRTNSIRPIIHQTLAKTLCSSSAVIKRTSLYEFHLERGAKMVPFAGYSMPISYNDLSIRDSHLHTRSNVSLFDVSHMLQLELYGKDRVKFLEKLVVADVENLPINGATLTLYTNANGGIIDDLIVSKKPDALYIVSNASRSEEDLKHLEEQMAQFIQTNPGSDLNMKILNDKSLLAFQGPKAAETIQQKLESVDLNSLKFMNGIETVYDGIPIRLTRCGYTGEDGFEIQVSNEQAANLADKLLQQPVSRLAGLGARDSLRLEAGLCLYGNDINMTTTPIQATLAWTIAKRRRTEANFLGAEIILQEMKDKPKIKRIGLVGAKSGPPVRAGSKIYKDSVMNEENLIGKTTSGCPSPSMGQNIAMAYVKSSSSKVGTSLFCEVRGKLYEYHVSKMPFVPSKYYL
ncbi:aminomethyltransferase [Dermatophagoides farinae]|uniref:Aminomethyltransferase n=2 Tax=Dermatophagoides farinae TaxID=6954 RepID=A0A9D4NPW1_DERFA|nr:aminomethyltransferase, mitochondrial-like [Dermatophagoides farinae]KAH7636271.1 aminomethyltransferase [Dermatophagoides farinae]